MKHPVFTLATTTTPTSQPMASSRNGSSTPDIQAGPLSRCGDVVVTSVSGSKCCVCVRVTVSGCLSVCVSLFLSV